MSWAQSLVSLNRPSRRIMEGYCEAALGRLDEGKGRAPYLGRVELGCFKAVREGCGTCTRHGASQPCAPRGTGAESARTLTHRHLQQSLSVTPEKKRPIKFKKCRVSARKWLARAATWHLTVLLIDKPYDIRCIEAVQSWPSVAFCGAEHPHLCTTEPMTRHPAALALK